MMMMIEAIDWLIDWRIDWLIDQSDWLIDRIDWSIDWRNLIRRHIQADDDGLIDWDWWIDWLIAGKMDWIYAEPWA